MSELNVFVSYARPDRSLAEEVFRRLRPMRVRVWSDDQLSAGDDWSDMLRKRLRESDYFLFVLTPRTLGSSWVLQELGAAWVLGKPIIPLVSDRGLLDKLPVDLSEGRTLLIDEMDKLEEVIQAA